jgi:D-3-phosphoglycerate dehydrogenase
MMGELQMKKILVTLTRKEEEIVPKAIADFCSLNNDYEVMALFNDTEIGEAELCERIKDVDAFIFGMEHVTETVLAAAPKLKILCKFGVGLDKIDLQAAFRRQVVVTNAPGRNSNAVAELAFGLMFALARQIPQSDAEMRRRVWHAQPGTEIAQKTLGIIGMGAIGKLLTKYASAFDMKVLAYDLFKNEAAAQELGFHYAEFDEILKEADYLSLHIPGDNSTKNLIGWKQLTTMKPTAYLINTARGSVVDEDALYQALETGVIAGAAIDSFAIEPPFDSKLLTSNKLIAMPHTGACTDEANDRVIRYSLQNARDFLEGKEPLNQVKLR